MLQQILNSTKDVWLLVRVRVKVKVVLKQRQPFRGHKELGLDLGCVEEVTTMQKASTPFGLLIAVFVEVMTVIQRTSTPIRQGQFVCNFPSHSRIFHSYGDVTITGEGLHILTYARHSYPSSSEGSLACHTYCDLGHQFIMVIFEDP